ncbi:MAG: hypothetical protein RLZZ171_2434 [Cyanobacteriota bacterium]|jgi:hypothetical protein
MLEVPLDNIDPTTMFDATHIMCERAFKCRNAKNGGITAAERRASSVGPSFSLHKLQEVALFRDHLASEMIHQTCSHVEGGSVSEFKKSFS